MALRAVLESLDGLAEPIQEQYRQGEDGRFYLDVTDVDSMPAIEGLRRKNRELLDKERKVKQRLDALMESLGVSSPEEAEALREKMERSGQGGGDAEKVREEYEAKLAQMRDQAKRETDQAREEADRERAAARNYFLDSEITRAIIAAQGTPELLGHVVRAHLDVERDDDGRFRLRVLGPDGQPRIKNSSGDPFGLDDLVEELKADPKYGRAFDAPNRTGGGAPHNSRTASVGVNPFKKESRNLTEQMRLMREQPETARRLAQEAGVSLPAA